MNLSRPVLIIWLALGLALGLFALQANFEVAQAAISIQASPANSSDKSPAVKAEPVTSDNLWWVIAAPIAVALVAVGLGYTVLRLTRDSG